MKAGIDISLQLQLTLFQFIQEALIAFCGGVDIVVRPQLAFFQLLLFGAGRPVDDRVGAGLSRAVGHSENIREKHVVLIMNAIGPVEVVKTEVFVAVEKVSEQVEVMILGKIQKAGCPLNVERVPFFPKFSGSKWKHRTTQ